MGWERTVRRARDRRGDRGAAAIEFAILLPVFLALTLAAIDFALAFRVKLMLHNAAGNAATYAAVAPCNTTDIVSRARAELPSSDVSGDLADPANTSVTVTLSDPTICTVGATTTGVTATVTVSSTYHLLTGTALGMFGVPRTLPVATADTVRVAGR